MDETAARPAEEVITSALGFIEGDALVDVLFGALKGWGHDHQTLKRFPDSLWNSLVKRTRGQIIGAFRERLKIKTPAKFDGRDQHCLTCSCGTERVARVAAALRAPSPPEVTR